MSSLGQEYLDKLRVRISVRPEIGDDNMTSLFGQPPQFDAKGKFYICHASCRDRILKLHTKVYEVSDEYVPEEVKEVTVTKKEVTATEKKLQPKPLVEGGKITKKGGK